MASEQRMLSMKTLGACLMSGIGFLADAYDLFVINIVKIVLQEIYGQTDNDASMVASTALWGAVAGQLIFGVSL
jgi:MFS transporter, PHS family, inorganic phosphate transporter